MQRMMSVIFSWVTVGLVIGPLPAELGFAWGSKGHSQIAECASTLTTTGKTFWSANTKNLSVLANVPDAVWKTLPTARSEKPTHYFQPDFYFSESSEFDLFPQKYASAVSKYSEKIVIENGTAVWRVSQLYALAVEAFRRGDYDSGLIYAGTMGHYVGDLSQPLHVTTNFDGQQTGDRGIHQFFETTNLDSGGGAETVARITSAATQLLQKSEFISQNTGPILDSTFNEVNRAYARKNDVINTDLRFGRKGSGATRQFDIAIERLADGTATLALLWSRIWQDAGNPPFKAAQMNSKPAWVVPNYSSLKCSISEFDEPIILDDCN